MQKPGSADDNRTLGDTQQKYDRDLNTVKLTNQQQNRRKQPPSQEKADLYEHMETDPEVNLFLSLLDVRPDILSSIETVCYHMILEVRLLLAALYRIYYLL